MVTPGSGSVPGSLPDPASERAWHDAADAGTGDDGVADSAPGVEILTRFDSIVVAGGRSSRLGGTPKARLPLRSSTLLAHTVESLLLFS